MTDMVVSAVGVSKRFADGARAVDVLNDVSLDVAAGEAVALMGPSGCGKSTLLGILGLLIAPSSGRILITGQDAPTHSSARAAVRNSFFGYLHQDFALIDEETAAENVAIPLVYARPRVPRRERRARSSAALLGVGLADFGGKRTGMLSGGERQRVAIARSLVNGPRMLLADEPTAALDASSAALVLDLIIAAVASGTGALIATHDDRVASRCDRVVHMLDGTIVQQPARPMHG